MKTKIFTDEEEVTTKAVDVLIKELRPVGASRFLTLPKKKPLESVNRHRP